MGFSFRFSALRVFPMPETSPRHSSSDSSSSQSGSRISGLSLASATAVAVSLWPEHLRSEPAPRQWCRDRCRADQLRHSNDFSSPPRPGPASPPPHPTPPCFRCPRGCHHQAMLQVLPDSEEKPRERLDAPDFRFSKNRRPVILSHCNCLLSRLELNRKYHSVWLPRH